MRTAVLVQNPIRVVDAYLFKLERVFIAERPGSSGRCGYTFDSGDCGQCLQTSWTNLGEGQGD